MNHFSRDGKKVCVTVKGQSLISYAIVLGIVAVALTGMTVYIKRGLQGRIRDMTDYFICDRHLTQISQTKSESTTDTTSSIRKKELSGGRIQLAYCPETKVQHSWSETEDDSFFSPQPFIPTDGHSETPEREDDETYIDPDWENEIEIARLEQEEQRLLDRAAELEAAADELEQQGNDLIYEADHMHCGHHHRRRCRRARRKMREQGEELLRQAEEKRTEAAELREEAARIHERIEELKAAT